MNNNRIEPRCSCCFPTQALVVTGRRGHCPLTEKIYEDSGDGNFLRYNMATPVTASPQQTRPPEWQTDFYPGRNRPRGDVAPVLINPAEDRFGA